jgi:glutathione S-transferase
LEIFWSSGSNFSWRVLLALEWKGIAYESRLLSFSAGDLRTPEFRAVNPRGRVPALRDGDVTVYESVAILAYLDRKHPEPPLFGRTPAESGLIWRIVCEAMNYLDPPTESYIIPLYFNEVEQQADTIRAVIPTIVEELERLEAQLTGDWLANTDAPSAADCVVYPQVRSLQRASEKPGAAPFAPPFHPLAPRFPRLAAWMKRIEALPGYERTYPPHWR